MKETTIEYIVNKLDAELVNNGECNMVNKVVIDSRKACKNSLFFAIIGVNNDGHKYLDEVRKNECRAVVISDVKWAEKLRSYKDMTVILVDDTTKALMNLAKAYLADWKGLKKVAVTGSVGKTSTKDFLGAVLSSKYITEKTPGNLNNEYGVPLTVFGLKEDTEAAVIEMGAGSGAFISELADIVKPDIAVVTNVWTAHLEVFGSREKLVEEKLGVVKHFGSKEKLIVNSGCDALKPDKLVKYIKNKEQIITVGSNKNDNLYIHDVLDKGIYGVSSNLGIKLGTLTKNFKLEIPVIGEHNLVNAALAVAAGWELGVDLEDAVNALADVKFESGRLEVIKSNNLVIVNDAYNASPESMKAGLRLLKISSAKRSVAILGDMFELGTNTDILHSDIGKYAVELGINLLITIGENARNIFMGAIKEKEVLAKNDTSTCVLHYDSKEEAISNLKLNLKKDDLIFVKASRGMKLEDVITAIERLDKNHELNK